MRQRKIFDEANGFEVHLGKPRLEESKDTACKPLRILTQMGKQSPAAAEAQGEAGTR